MIAFREDTSFPFLKIAREHGVDYGEVLRFVEDFHIAIDKLHGFKQWHREVIAALDREEHRRRGGSRKQRET